jgi:hypothetical protein
MIIDDIIRNPACWIFKNKNRLQPEGLKRLETAQVIEITNVSDYIYSHPQEIWAIWEDVPNYAPPFDNMWVEWNAPKFRNINGRIEAAPIEFSKCKCAAHFQTVKNDETGGWAAVCVYLTQRPDGLVVPSGAIRFNILKDGIPKKEGVKAFLYQEMLTDNINQQELADDIAFNVAIVGVAISFMHCKNTIIKQVSHPQRLQQARIKKGWKPLIRYHTLEIRPIKKILGEEGNASKNGIQKALHICRGHFKDYREGKGLFGKYKDMYWWDMHTRGDIDNGLVVKDYKVMTK